LDAHHRHPGIDGGLGFQQQIHIKPVLSETDPPNQIVLTVAQIIADITPSDLLQTPEVQFGDPLPRQKAAQQVVGLEQHLWVYFQRFNRYVNLRLSDEEVLCIYLWGLLDKRRELRAINAASIKRQCHDSLTLSPALCTATFLLLIDQ
jgi:hypothetical protein